MDRPKEVLDRNPSGENTACCFYCLGDRPNVHGTLPDPVVLYITERATSFEEALREFEEYEKGTDEGMRLNVIVRSQNVIYYEPFE